MSNIILGRIKPKVDAYLSQSQSAYRAGRSTSDIVWAHRFLAARVQKFREEIFIEGINLSSAFDTIKRSDLLNELATFLNDDEIRMIRLMLSKTSLEIKRSDINKQERNPSGTGINHSHAGRNHSHINTTKFTTNIGSPQGDGVSGCLFIIYFEMAMREVRHAMHDKRIENEHAYATRSIATLPEEMIYADDADFIADSKEKRDRIINTAPNILKKHNLKVNATKTEHTILKRSEKCNEEWRSTRKLGSLLGDAEDIVRRKQLASGALNKLNSMWIRKNKIRSDIRINLYRAIVKPVLLYNCQTWGLTKADETNLDSFHRKQLRKILHIKFPNIIRNHDLYELTNVNSTLTNGVSSALAVIRTCS